MTEDKAREIAHGLIQGYIGPDRKVIDMKAHFVALVQVLRMHGANEALRIAVNVARLSKLLGVKSD